MGKIVILDENTANKIAAGEVVERPASVIKELVENSIDAKATSIKVEIRNGGISYIKVSDNGIGIDDDDVELAFERHATSKIRTADELESIYTMGFRGEALASIASVSRVELVTRPQSKEHGSYVSVEGGKVVDLKQVGSPFGTTFTVRDLFYNTPARYKFLKRDTQEASYVSDVLERIALARPDISFNLKINNNSTLYTPGNNELHSVIYSVYGKDVASSIVPISYKDAKISIDGLVGKPELSRGTRREQSIFVNGRYIKSKLITSAIDEAYKTSLMKGRYAFVVINITLNPILVDVNVHPTKMEVRFSEEQIIFRAVYHAIQDALFARSRIPTVNIAPKNEDGFSLKAEKKNYSQQEINYNKKISAKVEEKNIKEFLNVLDRGSEELKKIALEDKAKNPIETIFHPINETPKSVEKLPELVKDETQNKNIQVEGEILKECSIEEYKIEQPQKIQEIVEIEALPEALEKDIIADVPRVIPDNTEPLAGEKEEQQNEANLALKNALIIGQAFNTYIILQKGEDIYLVDQHAAHERVIYERIKEKYLKAESPTQILAVPQVIEFTNSEYRTVFDNKNFFEKIGFIFEEFGNNSLIVRAVPSVLTDTNYIQSFKDILEYVFTNNFKDFSLVEDEAIYQIACKAAIKANKKLNDKEILELLECMEQLKNPYTCPHGRPTVLRLTKYEVEKMFKRAGVN